jgi:hypothetical protein
MKNGVALGMRKSEVLQKLPPVPAWNAVREKFTGEFSWRNNTLDSPFFGTVIYSFDRFGDSLEFQQYRFEDDFLKTILLSASE